jgi:hypothetical protein
LVRAQTPCNGPPLWSDIHTAYPDDPSEAAWRPGIPVSVLIFNTELATFQKIDEGIRRWNIHKLTNCSNVTFNQAEFAPPYYEYEIPPDNWIYVARTVPISNRDGDMSRHKKQHPNGLFYVASVTIRIKPGITYNPSYPTYVEYLATHETGHSFGLENEDPSSYNSVMGWYQGEPTYVTIRQFGGFTVQHQHQPQRQLQKS